MKTILKLLTLGILIAFTGNHIAHAKNAPALSITKTGATNGYYVGSDVSFTTTAAQSYYWTVSGPATIIGSRTSRNFTIRITGAGSVTVSVVIFANGSCQACAPFSFTSSTQPCPYSITEWIPMAYSSSCSCIQKRGDYSLYDCNGTTVRADWEVQPNSGGNCIYWGCSSPGTSRFLNTTTVKPIPMCAWGGLQVTVNAYQPGTNNLLASKVVTIQNCLDIKQFKTGEKDSGFDLQIQKNTLHINIQDDAVYTIDALDAFSNERLEISASLSKGTHEMDLSEKLLPKRMYLILLRNKEGGIVERKKMMLSE